MSEVLPEHYRLTLVARNIKPGIGYADIVISNDSLNEANNAMEELRRRMKNGSDVRM